MAWYIPVLIFAARIVDVSIGTVRTMLVIAGHRVVSAVLGFVEVIVWVLAVGGALKYLGESIVALLAYAGGFATGVLVGMWIEDRVAIGYRLVRVITVRSDENLAGKLRDKGYRVTRVEGHGRSGTVDIDFLVIRRRNLKALRTLLREYAPGAFVTVERVDRATGLESSDSRFARRMSERLLPVRK